MKSVIEPSNLAVTDPKAISKYHSARDILSSVPAMSASWVKGCAGGAVLFD